MAACDRHDPSGPAVFRRCLPDLLLENRRADGRGAAWHCYHRSDRRLAARNADIGTGGDCHRGCAVGLDTGTTAGRGNLLRHARHQHIPGKRLRPRRGWTSGTRRSDSSSTPPCSAMAPAASNRFISPRKPPVLRRMARRRRIRTTSSSRSYFRWAFLGGILLLGMWAAHFVMFLSRDFASVMGQAIVLQNFSGIAVQQPSVDGDAGDALLSGSRPARGRR